MEKKKYKYTRACLWCGKTIKTDLFLRTFCNTICRCRWHNKVRKEEQNEIS